MNPLLLYNRTKSKVVQLYTYRKMRPNIYCSGKNKQKYSNVATTTPVVHRASVVITPTTQEEDMLNCGVHASVLPPAVAAVPYGAVPPLALLPIATTAAATVAATADCDGEAAAAPVAGNPDASRRELISVLQGYDDCHSGRRKTLDKIVTELLSTFNNHDMEPEDRVVAPPPLPLLVAPPIMDVLPIMEVLPVVEAPPPILGGVIEVHHPSNGELPPPPPLPAAPILNKYNSDRVSVWYNRGWDSSKIHSGSSAEWIPVNHIIRRISPQSRKVLKTLVAKYGSEDNAWNAGWRWLYLQNNHCWYAPSIKNRDHFNNQVTTLSRGSGNLFSMSSPDAITVINSMTGFN